MDFEIKSFMEMNLIVDLVLLLIFSFTVLLKNPKFLIFMVLLNLCQYVIWVPDREILEAHQKLQEQAEKDRILHINQTELQDAHSQPAGNPGSGSALRMPEQTARIYNDVLQGMGAGENAAGTAMEISFGAWKKKLAANEKKEEGSFSLSPFSILFEAGKGDMQAAWFVVRLFWLAATFYLYIQRPQIGATVFAFNLLPIPFLATFVPYLWYRFNELAWVKNLNAWGTAGGMPRENVEFLLFNAVLFLALALPLVVFLVAGKTHFTRSRETGLRHYLDPERFDLMINGSRIPFSVNDNVLLAQDFNLNIKQLSYDPDNPHIWYLKTGTKVEFVEK